MTKLINEKQNAVVSRFLKLLRSGKDYTTASMYKDSGEPCFVSAKRAGEIIRVYYHSIITEEMGVYVKDNLQPTIVTDFANRFKVCEREARLIIRYIRSRNGKRRGKKKSVKEQ